LSAWRRWTSQGLSFSETSERNIASSSEGVKLGTKPPFIIFAVVSKIIERAFPFSQDSKPLKSRVLAKYYNQSYPYIIKRSQRAKFTPYFWYQCDTK
jgi:hypothetical protein